MSQKLVKLHNKCGVVSDGININSISKENEIENLKSELEAAKISVDAITKENISVATCNIVISLLTIALITILNRFELTIVLKIILPASFFLMTKIGLLCEFGTKKYRTLKLKELSNTINELEKKIPEKNRELQLMKQKVDFEIAQTTLDKTKHNDLSVDNENYIYKNKAKVLSLTKK